LISIIAGKTFNAAKISFIIMLFYPMAQVNGQLVGCLFFAYEDVKKYRNYNVIFTTISTMLTYFLIAPKHFFIPGLGADHSFFALKTFIVGLIGSDILIYKMSQKLKFDYILLIKYRVKIILIFLLICFMIQLVVKDFQNVILLTIIWIILYNAIVLLLAYCLHDFTGINNLNFYLSNIFKKISFKK